MCLMYVVWQIITNKKYKIVSKKLFEEEEKKYLGNQLGF